MSYLSEFITYKFSSATVPISVFKVGYYCQWLC